MNKRRIKKYLLVMSLYIIACANLIGVFVHIPNHELLNYIKGVVCTMIYMTTYTVSQNILDGKTLDDEEDRKEEELLEYRAMKRLIGLVVYSLGFSLFFVIVDNTVLKALQYIAASSLFLFGSIEMVAIAPQVRRKHIKYDSTQIFDFLKSFIISVVLTSLGFLLLNIGSQVIYLKVIEILFGGILVFLGAVMGIIVSPIPLGYMPTIIDSDEFNEKVREMTSK